MNIVLPLFSETPQQARDLVPLCGADLHERACEVASSLPRACVWVVTNSPLVVEACTAHGLLSVLAVSEEYHLPGGLPGHFVAAARALLKGGLLSPQALVAVVDWRRGRFEPGVLDQVFQLCAKEGGKVLASVQECRDHPVQCHVPHRLTGVELFVAPDASGEGRAAVLGSGLDPEMFRVTHPFSLDWSALDVWGQSPGLFVLEWGEQDGLLRARKQEALTTLEAIPMPQRERLFLRVGPCAARRVLAKDEDKYVPAYGLAPGLKLGLTRREDNGLSVDVRQLPKVGTLRLWALAPQAEAQGQEVELSALWAREEGGAPLIIPPSQDWAGGLLAAVVVPAGEDTYDFTEGPAGGDGLWVTEPIGNRRAHPVTGKLFANRQELFPLLHLDGVLAVGSVEHLAENGQYPIPLLVAGGVVSAVTGSFGRPGAGSAAPEAAGRACGGVEHVASRGVLDHLLHVLEAIEIRHAEGRADGAGGESGEFGRDFRAAHKMLEEARWKFMKICEAVDSHQASVPPRGACMFPNLSYGRAEAMQMRLRELSQARWERAVAETGGSALRLAPLALPGAMPDFMSRHITSDARSTFFLSAYCNEYKEHGLFAKDIDAAGRLTLLRQDCAYTGLWFDSEQQVLYALRGFAEGRPVCGVDMLDPRGRLLQRTDLPVRVGAHPFTPCMLSGDEKRLYFVDGPCRYILVLDKASLRLEDMLFPFGAESLTNFKPVGGRLLGCMLHSHCLQTMDVSGIVQARHCGPETVFPRLLDVDQQSGFVYVICVDHEPVMGELLHQRLNVYRQDLSLLRSVSLGQGRAIEMHVLAGRGLLATSDVHQRMQLFDLKALALFPETVMP